MEKFTKIIGALLLAVILCTPLVAKADPVDDVEQPLKIESFVLNSNENERINATLNATADTEIFFDYKVTVVTDISQEGKEVASGRGRTGEDVNVDINMYNINTYDNYRFKITVTYSVDEQEYFTTAYSKVFDYTQESYAEDLSGRDIVVDMSAKIVQIDWSSYDSYSAESVLVIIEVDGEKVVEDVIPRTDNGYEYYFNQDTKQITVTLKQVFDGKLSKGITDTIDIVKASDSKDFYVSFPSDEAQYNTIWSIDYFNADADKVYWKTDSDNNEIELSGNGSFLIEMKEENSTLLLNYTDKSNVQWKYEFWTDIVSYAPTVQFLEEYNGSSVEASSITLSGKVDDANATVKVNGEEVEVDANGMFAGTVDLEVGENVVSVEASNAVGKTSRTSLTIYKSGASSIVSDTSFFGQYSTLLITFVVSLVLLAILIVIVKKGGKKDENNEKKA